MRHARLRNQDIFPLFPHTEFVAVLSAEPRRGGWPLVAMVIMLEMLLRLRWFCRELETGALRQGDRSGGRQRWELGAVIVQRRDWSPDIKSG